MLYELKGLKRVREARVISQDQLAESADMTRRTISLLENLHTRARAGTAQKLAAALEVDVQELLAEEGTGLPLAPLDSPQRRAERQVELLEQRLREYEEQGQQSETRWLRLHGVALFLMENTAQRGLRRRLDKVQRRAFAGYTRLLQPELDLQGHLEEEAGQVA